jgi:hypothetical protein
VWQIVGLTPPHAALAAIVGGTKARTGGAGPVKRSISTSVLAQLGPWLSFDVPWSRVSTLALPCTQTELSSEPNGSYHAPHERPDRCGSR